MDTRVSLDPLTCPRGYGVLSVDKRILSTSERRLAMAHIAPQPTFVFIAEDGTKVEYPYTGEKYVEYDFLAHGQDENAEMAYWSYIRQTYAQA